MQLLLVLMLIVGWREIGMNRHGGHAQVLLDIDKILLVILVELLEVRKIHAGKLTHVFQCAKRVFTE